MAAGRREGNRAPRTPSFKKNRHNLLAFATGKAGSGGRAGPLRISLLPLVFLSTGRVRHDDDFPRSQRTALPRSPARSPTSAAVEGRVWGAWDHPGAANHRGAATEKECNPERSSFSARRRIAVSDALFAHLYTLTTTTAKTENAWWPISRSGSELICTPICPRETLKRHQRRHRRGARYLLITEMASKNPKWRREREQDCKSDRGNGTRCAGPLHGKEQPCLFTQSHLQSFIPSLNSSVITFHHVQDA